MPRLLLIVLCALSASAVGAQTSVGVRAGFGGARLSPRDGTISPASFRPGLAVGLFADVPVGRGVSVRPEVLYVQKGSRSFSTSVDFDTDPVELSEVLVETRVDYVEVPVLAHVRSPAGGRFRVGLMAGPAVAFRVGLGAGVARYVDGESDPFPPGSIVVVADPDPVDVGLAVGGDIAVGPVALDVRYTAGITEADPTRPGSRSGAVAAALSYRYAF